MKINSPAGPPTFNATKSRNHGFFKLNIVSRSQAFLTAGRPEIERRREGAILEEPEFLREITGSKQILSFRDPPI